MPQASTNTANEDVNAASDAQNGNSTQLAMFGESQNGGNQSRMSPSPENMIPVDEPRETHILIDNSQRRQISRQLKEFEGSDAAQRQVEKSAEQVDLILRSLNNNRLFRLLDDEQKETIAKLAQKHKYAPGNVLMRQGDTGKGLVVVEDGECKGVVYGSDPHLKSVVSTFSKGSAFGEQGLVYGTTRSSSVKAATPVTVWEVDRRDFQYALRQSDRVRSLFERHCSIVVDGEPMMTVADFTDAMTSTYCSTSTLERLFGIMDSERRGVMGFEQFALLSSVGSKPDPEFDIAFLLFDQTLDGFVSKADVEATLKRFRPGIPFDFECDLVKRFFGPNGNRKLRFYEFTEFFNGLQQEIVRQSFLEFDTSHNGYLTEDQFDMALKRIGEWRVPAGVIERLHYLSSVGRGYRQRHVTFGEFLAFSDVVSNMPAIRTIVMRACQEKGGAISIDEFKVAAKAVFSTQVNPLFVEVAFGLFADERDGNMTVESFDRVVPMTIARKQHEISEGMAAVGTLPGEKSGIMKVLAEAASNFALGAVAGGIGAACVYPIDLTKTRLQNQRIIPGQPPIYKSGFDCFMKVIRLEGARALYKGLGPQLIGVAPEKAIKLTVNDLLRGVFKNYSHDGRLHIGMEMLAGGSAGFSQVVFTNPLEIVKIRLQVQGEAAKGAAVNAPKLGAVQIVRQLGPLGLYKGAAACALRDVPFSAIYFPMYAAMKRKLEHERGSLSMGDLLLAGTVAGAPAAFLTTPADVIKTRLQVVARQGETSYSGIFDCARKVYAQEGWRAFFKGAGWRVCRSSPQFGVTLLVYELMQKFITPSPTNRPPVNVPVDSRDLRTGSSDLGFKIRGLDDFFGSSNQGTQVSNSSDSTK